MPDGKKTEAATRAQATSSGPKISVQHSARPIRILGEYIHPLVQLKREGIGGCGVVVVGHRAWFVCVCFDDDVSVHVVGCLRVCVISDMRAGVGW